MATRDRDDGGGELADHGEERGAVRGIFDSLHVAQHEEHERLERDAHVVERARHEHPKEVRMGHEVQRVRRK